MLDQLMEQKKDISGISGEIQLKSVVQWIALTLAAHVYFLVVIDI